MKTLLDLTGCVKSRKCWNFFQMISLLSLHLSHFLHLFAYRCFLCPSVPVNIQTSVHPSILAYPYIHPCIYPVRQLRVTPSSQSEFGSWPFYLLCGLELMSNDRWVMMRVRKQESIRLFNILQNTLGRLNSTRSGQP